MKLGNRVIRLCENVLGSKAYARKDSLIDQALSMGYISRKKIKRPEGQVGNPVWVVNYITPKGKHLLDQLRAATRKMPLG